MIAGNVLNGLVSVRHWENLPDSAFILDVRTRAEYRQGCLDGAVNIPVDELRQRMGELPKDREIFCHCFVGQRSYVACRILTANGFTAHNLSGGYLMFLAWQGVGKA